jgi:hypothetical protein
MVDALALRSTFAGHHLLRKHAVMAIPAHPQLMARSPGERINRPMDRLGGRKREWLGRKAS